MKELLLYEGYIDVVIEFAQKLDSKGIKYHIKTICGHAQLFIYPAQLLNLILEKL